MEAKINPDQGEKLLSSIISDSDLSKSHSHTFKISTNMSRSYACSWWWMCFLVAPLGTALMNSQCASPLSLTGTPANLLEATELILIIFLFLHPLNCLHAPNGLVGILLLKASLSDFYKAMKMTAGILGLSCL